ncbi:hypothetical protein CORC01_02109 [Colletotrichum orchidophilum]|uniref:Uncharacterized protein n=1 Tax=Colletotrichum orchidophilum TaxID=1209926 RepID=A0A1G4BN49_9PEZI|nr:uncharacterized protein CORC01_02109 [Colletotrichum orchidophilum]OHF02713.1 hypothetical protein CORC01_02109 [Colletotrichum orchidophilum]
MSDGARNVKKLSIDAEPIQASSRSPRCLLIGNAPPKFVTDLSSSLLGHVILPLTLRSSSLQTTNDPPPDDNPWGGAELWMASPSANGLFLFGGTPGSVLTTIMLLRPIQCASESKTGREREKMSRSRRRRLRGTFASWQTRVEYHRAPTCSAASSTLPTNNPCRLQTLLSLSIRRASFPSSHVLDPDAMPQL